MAQIDSVRLTKNDVASLLNGLRAIGIQSGADWNTAWGSSGMQRAYDAITLLLHTDESPPRDIKFYYTLTRREEYIEKD